MDTYGGVLEEAVDEYLQKFVFLDYAVQHWIGHFRDSRDQGMELFEFARLICEAGSGCFLTWFQVYWFNNGQFPTFPYDFTYLMTASWLGLGIVVDRLLEEEGEDVIATYQSKAYYRTLY